VAWEKSENFSPVPFSWLKSYPVAPFAYLGFLIMSSFAAVISSLIDLLRHIDR
jgi:hypothetical protein